MKTALFIGFASAAVVASPILAMVSQSKPEVGEIALVIASPFGVPMDQILSATNIAETYPDRAPLGAFVYLENAQNYEALFKEGAWLVLRGEGILKLC